MQTRNFTAENWGSPPYNRSSFQYVQSLFPTARLRRGAGPISALPSALTNVSDITYDGPDGNPRSVQQMLDDTFTDAFLVMKDGVIVTEEYHNGMGADSHHLLNSISKSFVGMLVGILQAEGQIDPAEPLTTYIPEFANTAFVNTTLQHALDMTAAVKYGEDYVDPQADFWKETAVIGWRPALVDHRTANSLFDHACSLTETEQRDGEHFHYRTVLTNVAGMAVERATGRPLQSLVEEMIWQKLAPEQDAVVVVDSTGFPYFGAGLNACARDLARFGQMLLHDGAYNDQQIVPKQWLQQTLNGSQELRRLFAAGDYSATIPGGHYHNQVWADAENRTMYCIGIHGQTIYVDQLAQLVVVKLSTHPASAEMELFADTFAAMQGLAAAL